MVVPILSVTAIGLFVALRRQHGTAPTRALAGAGVAGAWAGFLVFFLIGVLADILLLGAVWPMLIGHLGAYGVARLAAGNRARAGVLAG